MTIVETIIQGIQSLPLHKQVEVARYVHGLNANALQARAEILRRTHGTLDEADGIAFEEAMQQARRVETHA